MVYSSIRNTCDDKSCEGEDDAGGRIPNLLYEIGSKLGWTRLGWVRQIKRRCSLDLFEDAYLNGSTGCVDRMGRIFSLVDWIGCVVFDGRTVV